MNKKYFFAHLMLATVGTVAELGLWRNGKRQESMALAFVEGIGHAYLYSRRLKEERVERNQ